MGMQFNDTTNKQGLIQECEFWTNLGDGTISGDATLLAQFTNRLNRGFDEVLPLIFQSDAKWQWDDQNHAGHPIATTALVSGQPDYSFVSDDEGNSVLEIYAVYVKDPTGEYKQLRAVDSGSDPQTRKIFAQNTENVGTPTRYDKIDTTIWLDPVPNYGAAAGVKAVFARSQSYFASTDTTKQAGIPSPFHALLAKCASRDWIIVNKSESTALLASVNNAIQADKAQLMAFMSNRSRDERTVMRARVSSSR